MRMSYKQKLYKEKIKEYDEGRKRILTDIVTAAVEEYAKDMKLMIRHPFSTLRDVWEIVDEHERTIHFLIDHDKEKLRFEAQGCLPSVEIAIWNYEELFEANTFSTSVQTMQAIRDM